EGAAALTVDTQYHGLNLFVFARLTNQAGQRLAANLAGALLAVEDHAAGDDDAHQLAPAADPKMVCRGELIMEVDTAEIAVLIGAHLLDQPVIDFDTRLQRIHQLPGQRRLAAVATFGGIDLVDAIDVVIDFFGCHSAPRCNRLRVLP